MHKVRCCGPSGYRLHTDRVSHTCSVMVGMYTCGNSLTCYLYPHFLLAESDFSPTSPSFHAHLYNAAVASPLMKLNFFVKSVCETVLKSLFLPPPVFQDLIMRHEWPVCQKSHCRFASQVEWKFETHF